MKINEKDQKIIDSLKIGKLVKSFMTIILEKNLISEKEIQNLMEKDYSKDTLYVIFPILKKVNNKISLKENGMINGNRRYYAQTIENNKTEYLLTNEWKEFHRENFVNWMKRKVSDLE
ncbi:MAG: hypothetical protein ACJA2M_002046 [Polaribacter sp.]|jgi:hypothetical protein